MWQRRWLPLTFSSTFSVLLFVFDDAATPSPQGLSPSHWCCSYRVFVPIESTIVFRKFPKGFSSMALRLPRHLCDTNLAQIYSLSAIQFAVLYVALHKKR